MSRSSSTDSVSLALIVALGVIYAVVAKIALDAFPFSGDEYSTSLQAQLFAKGLLHAPAPQHAEWLRIDHVVIDTLVRSKYPPGASALLALGWRQGVPWLVTPIEGVFALVFVWHTTRRLLGSRPALVAMLTLGLAPLFSFQAASFYAHTATTMFLAVAFAAVALWATGKRTGWLVLAGAMIGCAFLCRPIDAVLFGVAMLVFRNWRAIAVTAASALPFVALNLAYQDAQFGSPFTDGYHAYEPTFLALYGAESAAHPVSLAHLFDPAQQWNHLDIFRSLCIDWTVPGTAIVAVFGAFAIGKDHPRRAIRNFCIALIATFAIALLPMISDPDDGAHPRYLSVTLIPLAVLVAAGFAPACEAIANRFGRRIKLITIVAAVLFSLAQLGSILVERIPKVWLREGLYQQAEAFHLHDAVVVVRAQYPSRYARNGPFFDGVLYLSAPPATTVQEVAAAYPGREVWEAREGVKWTFTRVQ